MFEATAQPASSSGPGFREAQGSPAAGRTTRLVAFLSLSLAKQRRGRLLAEIPPQTQGSARQRSLQPHFDNPTLTVKKDLPMTTVATTARRPPLPSPPPAWRRLLTLARRALKASLIWLLLAAWLAAPATCRWATTR